MAKIKNPENLKKGDIILYAGSDIISRIINYFDESVYSHASIYMGDGIVMESSLSGGGCKENTLSKSAEKYDHVFAKRHQNEPMLDMNLVMEKARQFKDSGYDVIQIIQLGLIGLNRKLARYDWHIAKLWSKVFDIATEASLEKFKNGDYRTVCSEFVYRCYHDVKKSKTDIYEINVGNAGKNIVDGKEKFKIANRFIEPQSLASIYFDSFSYDPHLELFERINVPDIPDSHKTMIHEFEKFSESEFEYFDDISQPKTATDYFISKKDQEELEELFEEMQREHKKEKFKEIDDYTHDEVREKLSQFMYLNSPLNLYDGPVMKSFSKSEQRQISINSYLLHRQHFVTTKDLVNATNLIEPDNVNW